MVKDNLAHQIVATPKDEIVIDEIPVKWCTVSLSEIIERGKRLEASVYDVEAKQAREIIADAKYPLTTLGGADGMTTSYTGARFKRIWVEKSDYPIYQPSTMLASGDNRHSGSGEKRQFWSTENSHLQFE